MQTDRHTDRETGRVAILTW